MYNINDVLGQLLTHLDSTEKVVSLEKDGNIPDRFVASITQTRCFLRPIGEGDARDMNPIASIKSRLVERTEGLDVEFSAYTLFTTPKDLIKTIRRKFDFLFAPDN